MFEGDPFVKALLVISILLCFAVYLLYCLDFWRFIKYGVYRHCSCKKKAEKVIIPEAMVTRCPVTIECREITPVVVIIC